MLAITPVGRLPAQDSTEPVEFSEYGELIVAPTHIAWRSAWSPDERWIATSYGAYRGNLGRLRVWDANSGKVLWEAIEKRGIRAVVVSPDGSVVASGNYGGIVHLRNAGTGRLLKTFEGVDQTIHGLAFSSDGRRLVSCGRNHKLHVWDVATGALRKTIEGHTDVTNGAQYSPDNKLLLSYGRDRSVRIWNADDGALLHLLRHPQEVYDATFLQGGKQVATACADGLVRVFHVDSGEVVTTLPGTSSGRVPVFALANSSDGKLLVTADQRVRIWKTESWENIATLPAMGFVAGLAFSKDAKSLLISNGEASVNVWDVPSQSQRLTFPLPDEIQVGAGQVRSLTISPDGHLIATAEGESHWKLRDRRTGKILRSFDAKDAVNAVAFSPTGQALAAVGQGVCLWDVSTGDLIARLADQREGASTVAWSPDGRLLATGGADASVRLWDVAARTQLAILPGHTAEVHSLAFTPDGLRLVSGSSDSTARVWDVEKKTLLESLDHVRAVRAVAVSPDGKTIVTAGDDMAVQFWNAATMKLQAVQRAHQQAIVALAFSPQGKTLASGASGGGIALWNTPTAAKRKVLNGHSQGTLALCFLADGSGLISGSADQSIRIWRAVPPRNLK